MLRWNEFRTGFVATALPLSVVICGCGPSAEARPELQRVRGTLMVNGEPAMGATLVLHPSDDRPFDSRGTRPKATVQADGSFELMTYQEGDGAPPGEYDAAVLWLVDMGNTTWDKLDGRLSNPDQTGIHVSVVEGRQELKPIELDGVSVSNRPPAKPSSGDVDGLE